MTDSPPEQLANLMLPVNEPERLAALHRYQILDTPAEAAFDRITTLAARLFKIPTVLISLVDESRAWFKSSIGFGAPEVPRDATICSFAVLTDAPLIVPDTRLDERFVCNPFVQCEPGMRFYAGAPLIDRDGFNLGTLCLLDSVPHAPLTAEQQATLVDLAAMVVDELELRLAAQQIARVDAALIEITQGVARVTGGDFFNELVRHFAKVLGTDYVYIGVVEGNEPKMLRTIATCDRGNIVENLEYRLQDTPCWEAIEQRKICCYPRNVQARFPNAPLLKPLSVESYVAIPFYGSDGQVLGLLGVMDGKPLVNVQLAESLLTIFATRIATELERQQYELMLVEQTQLLEAVSTGQPLDECLSALCSSIAKLSPSTRACVLLSDVRRQKFSRSITPDFPPSLSQGLQDAPISELAIGTCGQAVYCGEPVTCPDIANDDRWLASWRDLCIIHGIRACYSVPIMGIDNLPIGSLLLCFNEARLPTDWEYKLGEFGTKIASITIERKQAAANLEQSNARFESAMLAIRGMVFEWHLPTQIMYRSAGLFELLGIRNEAALPTNEWWQEQMHPDDLERVRSEFLAVPAGIDRFESEYRVRHGAGHWVYVSDRSYFQYDADGKLLKVIGFNTDITKRKQAEENLRQSQALAQRQLNEIAAIYQTAPIGLAILDPELRYERINQRLAEINGIAAQDHIGRTVREIVPALADENEPLLRSVFATGKPLLNIEISGETLALPGVKRTWIENCYPLQDETGQIVGINVVVQEITDRKRAEAELRESEERFRTLADNMSQFAWMTDENGWIFWYNRRWFEYTGTTLAQMQGWGWQQVHHPEHVDRVVELFRHHLEIGEEWEDIFPLRGRDGQYRWFLSRAIPIRNETGQVIRWFGTNTDITELQQAEAALAERNQELDSFVHTVSHDLKAPLRAIANLSVWIEEDLEDRLPPDNQQQFQLLRTRVKRMESMVDNLLLYARSGRQGATLETFDLAELLREIIDSLAPPAGFRIEIEPPLPTLTTKRVFLSQVFANLISNAIKHHTSATGHLHISAIEHPNCHEFIIRDDGPGIAPEHHERVFAIFQTLKVKENSDSTGIGLAIVKKIVETEAGTIRLESSLGRGTTFYVTWPKSDR
jgi:PAS domain S-box-containing protein